MNPASLSIGGCALFLLLGIRHALEPDHVAAIDGMTLRALDAGAPHAPWTGGLFALGHCAVVLILAGTIGVLAHGVVLPPQLLQVGEWLPIGVLLLLGAYNLRALVASPDGAAYRLESVRMRLMPAALRQRTGMWSAVLIGALFAMVVDTVVHVSAWGAFVTSSGSLATGVVAGAAFSTGLLLTSTTVSQVLCLVLRRHGDAAQSARQADRYRRAVGWLVVSLSFGVALTLLADKLGVLNGARSGAAPGSAWLGVGTLAALSLLWVVRRLVAGDRRRG